MPTTSPFPDGTALVSSALTQEQFNIALQSLTVDILGIDPTSDPEAYSKVRLAWPTEGQPAWAIADDVCCIAATLVDDWYNRIRNVAYDPNNPTSLNQATQYTRCWQVHFSLYGPNSFDHARLIKSALFLDWTHDALAESNLYLVTDVPDSTRSPELFQGQWWERNDLTVRFYEDVTETITVQSGASVEVITITQGSVPQGLGETGYGQGIYGNSFDIETQQAADTTIS